MQWDVMIISVNELNTSGQDHIWTFILRNLISLHLMDFSVTCNILKAYYEVYFCPNNSINLTDCFSYNNNSTVVEHPKPYEFLY